MTKKPSAASAKAAASDEPVPVRRGAGPKRDGAPKRKRAKRTKKQAAKPRRTPAADGRVVAITGAFGFLGRRLIRLLVDDPTTARIVALDIREPVELVTRDGGAADPHGVLATYPEVSAHTLDITDPGSAARMAEIFAYEGVTHVVHLAFLSNPSHHQALAHELETIGTMHVLHAAARANVTRLISLSSTMCYGACPDNPAWLTESHALRGDVHGRFVRDKIDAERQINTFAGENPNATTVILRLGAMLGGSQTRNFWTRYLTRKAVPTVLGYDPLLQFLHPRDAVLGLNAALRGSAAGTFNLVGRGVLPLSHVVERLARTAVPVPARLFSAALGTMWNAQLSEMPPSLMEFLRWAVVADGAAMARAFDFDVTHDIAAVLEHTAQEFS